MTKRIHGGWFIAELVLVLAVVVASAQTTTPSWSGVETQQLLASCQLHNSDSVVCVATDGVAFSFQGAAFVKVASQGATGPAGPQGPAGATGAAGPQGIQGIPGPVQSFNSLACGTSNQSNTGLTASSCKQTTP
jgi:hypothetical protein